VWRVGGVTTADHVDVGARQSEGQEASAIRRVTSSREPVGGPSTTHVLCSLRFTDYFVLLRRNGLVCPCPTVHFIETLDWASSG